MMTRTDKMLLLYASLLPARLVEASHPNARINAVDDARTNAWADASLALAHFERMQKLAR
jgi:hypothetical protein